jgi:hypothetical protein
MRVHVDSSWENDPLGACIAPQKIDCWIIPREPSQDQHRRAGKCVDANCSMPWLEKEHCDLNV